ncbi:MAG: FkbM family methyltransferase [Bacteroidetes bacterium]|nr:FkbM family methyltransferase [Bacteroidota bacterium]
MIKRIAKRFIKMGGRNSEIADPHKISFSQSGEDIIVEYLLGLRNITIPTFLDIGGYHPVYANNTYKFFLKGARGVNIDANPAAIESFKMKRPQDVNLNVGVGSKEGNFPFFIMEEESLNTFSEEEMYNLESLGHQLKQQIDIPVVEVNKILEKYFKAGCDFFSLDAEGVDFEIIQSFDFDKYAPKVICIETINYTPDGTGSKRTELCTYIEAKGYFEYANTNINSIYVNKNWWFTKPSA